jgi:hypothetical protein
VKTKIKYFKLNLGENFMILKVLESLLKSFKRIFKIFKASIPLKMHSKSLAILEKASISLKKSLKIIEIFIKVPHF